MRNILIFIVVLLTSSLNSMERELKPFLGLPEEIQLEVFQRYIAQEPDLATRVQLLAQLRRVNMDLCMVLEPANIGYILRSSNPSSDNVLLDQNELVGQADQDEDGEIENYSSEQEAFSEDNPDDKRLNPMRPLDTLLLRAIAGHSAVWAAGLLAAKAGKDARDFDDGYTGLHIAAQEGSTSCIQALLGVGADIESKDECGCTALHHAAAHGKRSCLKLLLAQGANIHAIDEEDETPLDKAIAHNQDAIKQILIVAGAQISLLYVAAHGTADMLNELLANNPDLAVTDDDGNTPLHYAAMEGKHANVKILLASKAESQVRNLDGDAPYDMAKAYGHDSCARLLRRKRK